MKKISLIVIGLMFFLGLTGSMLMGMAPGLIKILVGFLSIVFLVMIFPTIGYLIASILEKEFIPIHKLKGHLLDLTVLGAVTGASLSLIGKLSYHIGNSITSSLGFKL